MPQRRYIICADYPTATIRAVLLILAAVFALTPRASATPNQLGTTDAEAILVRIEAKATTDASVDSILRSLRLEMHSNDRRYFFLDSYGWIDGRHFFWTAENTRRFGRFGALCIGFLAECYQYLRGQPSGFSSEDLKSNAAGGTFAVFHQNSQLNLADAFRKWSTRMGARNEREPATGFEELPLKP